MLLTVTNPESIFRFKPQAVVVLALLFYTVRKFSSLVKPYRTIELSLKCNPQKTHYAHQHGILCEAFYLLFTVSSCALASCVPYTSQNCCRCNFLRQ